MRDDQKLERLDDLLYFARELEYEAETMRKYYDREQKISKKEMEGFEEEMRFTLNSIDISFREYFEVWD